MTEEDANGTATDEVQAAVTFLETALEKMGLEASVDARLEKKFLRVRIHGKDAESLVIGRGSAAKSDVLDAFQLLLSRSIYQGEGGRTVVIDANDYRDSRLDVLAPAADRLGDLAIATSKTVNVYGMNSFDRRAIHLRLADRTDVNTTSEGEGVFRAISVTARKSSPPPSDEEPADEAATD